MLSRWATCITPCCGWWRIQTTDEDVDQGIIGLFRVVEDRGRAVLLAHAVPLDRAEPYGDMLTTEVGHYEFWSTLAGRGVEGLRKAGLPAAPAWSEPEEWPHGRVLYDRNARCFVIRADRQLHLAPFVRLIAAHFRVATTDPLILPDDHYRSGSRAPLPRL